MRQVLRNRVLAGTVLAGFAATTVACGAGPQDSPTEASGSSSIRTVHLATVQNMLHVPEFVAAQRGIYVKHGLDVKLDILQGGADVGKALESGTAQFGSIGSSTVPTQRAGGLMVKVVAPVMNDATTATYAGPLGIVGRKDSGVKADDVGSLVGKRVGFQEGSTNHDYLLFLLKEKGIDPKRLDLVPLTTTDHPVSLKQGDIDAVASWEPFVSQEIRDLGDNAVVVSRGEPTLGYVIGVVATDEEIKKDPELMTRFASATAEAMQWTRKNPDGAAKISTNYINGLELTVAKDAMEHLRFDPRLTRCTQDALYQTGVDLVRSGQLKSSAKGPEMVAPDHMAEVEKKHPEWFSDLPEVPAKCRS